MNCAGAGSRAAGQLANITMEAPSHQPSRADHTVIKAPYAFSLSTVTWDVPPNWQRKWPRLKQMSWEELRTRTTQAAAKRLDFLLYRLGHRSRSQLLKSQPSEPRFFFDKPEGAANRALLLRTYLPDEAVEIIRQADNICRHSFDLLGYEHVDFGSPIDWHLDPVHGKRSPLKPWYRINFLDFDEVGDHKIIWELNRHQHLVTLAKAWCLTSNQVYTTELTSQWYSWQQANLYPLGINWASSLEVAFRSVSWLWIQHLLPECKALPAKFQDDLLLALEAHGRYVERYLSTYFSPNTHLLGEAAALIFLGTLCPKIPTAERWRRKGWKIISEEAERQVRPDGVYFEQSLYYHVYALDFFLHVRALAALNGHSISARFDSVIRAMLDVVQALSTCGPPEGFGDDDGGRVFNPRRNRTEHLTDPLALGAVQYESDEHPSAALTEEAIWLFGEKAISVLGSTRSMPRSASRAFQSGGIYVICDDQPCCQQMMIDGGPQGIGRAGHGHADALCIRLSLAGRRFLIDAGTYCYVSSEGESKRDLFRGTGAHNTVRIDQLDQAIPDGPFGWNSIPNVKAELWLSGRTFDFFAGSHDGYCRLAQPVLHRRSVFHVKSGIWFVRDVLQGEGIHLLESFWHFASDVHVTGDEGVVTATGSDKVPARVGLALLIDHNCGWNLKISESFVSPAYGLKQAAPVVCASVESKLPKECGVLLVPFAPNTEIGKLWAIGDNSPNVQGYRYQSPRTNEFLFFGSNGGPWTCGPWSSDATLLYFRLEQNRLAHAIMVSGGFAEWRGRRFISRPTPGEIFEWGNSSEFTRHSSSALAEGSQMADFEFTDLQL